MRVLLQRNLFLGGNRYRRDRYGTEIPDFVGDRKVVLYDEKLRDDDSVQMLPKDTVLYTKPDELQSNDLISRASAQRPVALSELTPKTDAEKKAMQKAAKKADGEDDAEKAAEAKFIPPATGVKQAETKIIAGYNTEPVDQKLPPTLEKK